MNLQKLNSLILCNKALICENNCTHLIESGGILTYKEGLSLLGNIMQIQSINVGGAWFLLIRSPTVHLGVRNSRQKMLRALEVQILFQKFHSFKEFWFGEIFREKVKLYLFFPKGYTCFWCNIVLMSFFYQFNSANDQKHSYFAIWENESASFLFCRCVIHCFWEDSLLLYVTVFLMPINEYYHIL